MAASVGSPPKRRSSNKKDPAVFDHPCTDDLQLLAVMARAIALDDGARAELVLDLLELQPGRGGGPAFRE